MFLNNNKGYKIMSFYKMVKTFIRAKFEPVVSRKYVDILTDDKSMQVFMQSFTSSTFDEKTNYEFYEQMGDVTANKFLVYYFYERFPALMCPLGVKVVARLKINYGSKKTFSRLAEKEGFWPCIRASDEWKDKRRMDLLEDTFEAFIGATEFLIDTRVEKGLGAVVIGSYLNKVFDEEPISLRYTDLYDSKTRLKELFDKYSAELGKIRYTETKDYDETTFTATTTSRITLYPPRGRPETLSVAVGRIKSEAQRAAAENAILVLRERGFHKPEPVEYAGFSRSEKGKGK
jgi:dsRNA-specific ribonuclease